MRDVFNPVPALLSLEDHSKVNDAAVTVAPDGAAPVAPSDSTTLALADGSGGGGGGGSKDDASPAVQLSNADFDALIRHHRATLWGKFQQVRQSSQSVSQSTSQSFSQPASQSVSQSVGHASRACCPDLDLARQRPALGLPACLPACLPALPACCLCCRFASASSNLACPMWYNQF